MAMPMPPAIRPDDQPPVLVGNLVVSVVSLSPAGLLTPDDQPCASEDNRYQRRLYKAGSEKPRREDVDWRERDLEAIGARDERAGRHEAVGRQVAVLARRGIGGEHAGSSVQRGRLAHGALRAQRDHRNGGCFLGDACLECREHVPVLAGRRRDEHAITVKTGGHGQHVKRGRELRGSTVARTVEERRQVADRR